MSRQAAYGRGARRVGGSAAVLIAFLSLPSGAAEIFRWVDDDGIVHFSDTRPRHETTIETVELRTLNPDSYDPADDPYSILNQAERLQAAWNERSREKSSDADRRQAPIAAESETRRPRAPSFYYPAYASVPAPPRRFRPGAGGTRAQSAALAALDLGGQRPASINSGVHRDRVIRSESLPTVRPAVSP